MSTLVERLELLITANAKGAVAGLKEAEIGSTGLDSKAKLLTGGLQKMGIQGNITGAIMKSGVAAGTVVAGAAVAKMALEGVNHFSSLTAEARTYQRVLGDSAEDASRVAAQVRAVGMDATQAQTGFFQLAKRIGEGTDTLKNWGVEVVRAKDGSVDMAGTIANVAAEYQSLNSADEKAAFLFENFGRAGQSLAPILSRSREELKGFADEAGKNHEIFSADQLEQGRQFDISMRELHASVTGLEITLGEGLVPVLTETARTITDVVQVTNKLTSAFGGVKTIGEGVGKALNLLPATVHTVIGLFHGGSGGADEFATAQKHLSDASAELQKVESSGTATHREHAAAVDAVRQANAELAPIQKRVTDAMTEAGIGEDVLASGTDKLADATKRQADAAKQAADALDKQYQATLTMTNADLGLEGANINLDQAAVNLVETLKEHGATSLEAREATLRLKEAVEAQSQAVYEVTAAHYGAQAGIDAQKGALERLKEQFPELNDFIQTMIDRLNSIPPSREVRINAFLDVISNAPGGAAGFYAAGGYLPDDIDHFAGGGVVGGPVGAARPAVVHGGETVFTPEQMAVLGQSLGGGGGVTTLQLSGGPPGLAEWFIDQINQASRGGPVILAAAVG